MKILLPVLLLFVFACEDTQNENQENSLLFVASEGNYGNSDGSISVFNGENKIQIVENVGDVVQAVEVYNDNLFVIVNNSHLIKRYSISESGLKLPGFEIATNSSSPREMCIVDNKLYFTNWVSQDVKVLNLETYSIEASISLPGVPEDIVSSGDYLWVSIPNLELYDTNEGSSVIKIDIMNQSIVEIYEVGFGPQHLILDGDFLWIARIFYNSDWEAFYGSSRLNINSGEVVTLDYGQGTVCGGNIIKLNDQIYRTANGGVMPLDSDLSLNQSQRIGSYQSVYSASAHQESVFLGVSDFVAPDTVYIHNELGNVISTLSVDVLPGDYAIWSID